MGKGRLISMGKGSGDCQNRGAMHLHGETENVSEQQRIRSTDEHIYAKCQGTTLGLGIGDALGAPIEFMSREKILAELGGPLTEMIGGGVWDVRPGQITDDTEMALGLARSLEISGEYHPHAALHQYLKWFDNDPVDVGSTIRAVLTKAKAGYPAEWAAEDFHHASGGMSAGNGSLMRVAPLAIHYRDDLEAMEDAVRTDCHLTHFDPLAGDSAVYFTKSIAQLVNHENAELELPDDPQIRAAVLASPAECQERSDTQMGFVLTALAIGCCATRNAKSYEEGLVWAINLGGDTDTNGAVAGAMLGAKFGDQGIPERWKQQLETTEEIHQLTHHSIAGSQPLGQDIDFGETIDWDSSSQGGLDWKEAMRGHDPHQMSVEELEDAYGLSRGFLTEDPDLARQLRDFGAPDDS